MTKRENIYNYVRVFACIGIVGLHVTGSTSNVQGNSVYMYAIIENSFRMCLPLFFILSGSLLLNKDYSSLREYYGRRFMSVIIPFWIYSMGYSIFTLPDISIKGSFSGVGILKIIKSIPSAFLATLSSKQYFHLWFMYALIGIYIVIPFIRIMLRNMDESTSKKFIVVILLVTFINTTLKVFKINITINEFIFAGWIKYVILGYFIIQPWFRKYLKYSIGIGTIAYIAAYIIVCFCPQFKGINFYDLGTLELLQVVGLFSLFIFFKDRFKDGLISNIVAHISKYTFSVYLVHGGVMRYAYKIYDYSYDATNGLLTCFINILMGTVIVFVLSFIISVIIDNTIIKMVQFIVKKIYVAVDKLLSRKTLIIPNN